MRRLYAVVLGGFLSMFLVSGAMAAPKGPPAKPKEQGIKNARKAMAGKLERDKKVNEVRKQGQAMRRQAQSGK